MKDRIAIGLALTLLALAPGAWAAAPEVISYQGLLTDDQGVVVADDLYGLRFEIYDAPDNGTLLFQQSLQVTVVDGLYNVLLSANQHPSGATLTAVFANALTYMAVVIESGPGIGPEIALFPRQRIASVPYAIQSADPPQLPIPTILDAATKSDDQTIPAGATDTILASGGSSDLEVIVDLPSVNYVVTVLAKVVTYVPGSTGDTQVVFTLLEDCGSGASVVDAGRWRENDNAEGWNIITLLYVDESPVALACTYSITGFSGTRPVTINNGNGNTTTIVVRADPL